MHFCSKFGNCNFNWWWVMACTSSKWGKFWFWSSIWPWRSRSIIPQSYRALNQGLLHLWSKFGDPSLNSWWVIARTNSWLTDTQTHRHTYTHTRGQRQYPKAKTGFGLKMKQDRTMGICCRIFCEVSMTHWRIVTVPGVLSCCVKVSGGGVTVSLMLCVSAYTYI